LTTPIRHAFDEQLAALQDDTQRRLGASDAAIFKAHAALLDDTDLITRTCQLMVEGHGVAWSWHQAIEHIASGLAALGNPVLAGRAADLRDVGRRVLAQLDPSAAGGGLADLPAHPCILIAADLSPSDTANLDTTRVIGLATAQGGPTSHTAILSRTLGLPALVAGGGELLAISAGREAIIDGSSGRLYLSPSEADLASARAWIAEQQQIREREAAQRAQPAWRDRPNRRPGQRAGLHRGEGPHIRRLRAAAPRGPSPEATADRPGRPVVPGGTANPGCPQPLRRLGRDVSEGRKPAAH